MSKMGSSSKVLVRYQYFHAKISYICKTYKNVCLSHCKKFISLKKEIKYIIIRLIDYIRWKNYIQNLLWVQAYNFLNHDFAIRLCRTYTYVHVSYASSWKAKELATHLVIPVVTTSFFLVFVIAFRLTWKESQRPEVCKKAHAVTRGRWQRQRCRAARNVRPTKREGVDALVRTSSRFSRALKRARALATPRN